jgi:hypothetical protein
MTQINKHFSELNDDDLLGEYDFNQFSQGIRGKHAEELRQGYSVTVHHEDGTSRRGMLRQVLQCKIFITAACMTIVFE